MSAEKGRPLTHAQRGKLGGYGAAKSLTPEELSERGRKGGLATSATHNKAHYARMALRRWGMKVDLTAKPKRLRSKNGKTPEGAADPGHGE